MKHAVVVPRELPGGMVVDIARRAEDGGLDELWVIEDYGYTSGTSLAAAALAVTERITVGIGILPAVVRNAAFTAMELTTLAELGPGRIVGGIGHGVQEWMGQLGIRPASPLTALDEVITAVRRLLRGERVSVDGDYVVLDDVVLDRPPTPVPPVLAGVRGPKSLALAGRVADGIILTELTGPSAVAASIAHAAPTGSFETVVFTATSIAADRGDARRPLLPLIEQLVTTGQVGVSQAPFYDELRAMIERDGIDAIVDAPQDWWVELGAIGTPDDVTAHIAALGDAGADVVACFLPPIPDLALDALDSIIQVTANR